VSYRLTRQAKSDIKAIIRYTDENFGADQTEAYLAGLYDSFELLTANPKMGHEWSANRRRYIYRMHAVYYRITASDILVTQIRHTAMSQP
jgi:toxin ParE1/3/4